MTNQSLPDRWASRDFPVLIEAARRLDDGQRITEAEEIAADLDVEVDQVYAALDALVPLYLSGESVDTLAGRGAYLVNGITERGRRAVGLWPREEAAADALIELLEQAADHVDDEDDAGALRRAGRLLKTVPAAVLAEVTGALILQQTGIG
jgi:hypothetical protein